jgi:hypothetical protein
MKLKRLGGHPAAPRSGYAHSATFVAAHHANYEGPEARMGEFPAITIPFLRVLGVLASFPLCAFVVKSFPRRLTLDKRE